VRHAEKAPGPGRAGLLENLMSAIRPEFRVDVLIADPDDPVLGGNHSGPRVGEFGVEVACAR
jgi:hypothetical protein